VPEYRDFTVMSFNVRTYGLEDHADKFWDARKEDVLALILRHSPDLIGFQEAKEIQYDYLKENLTEYGSYGKNGWGDDDIIAPLFGGINAIFYKKDRFELLESNTLWLSDTPEVRSSGWDAPSSDMRTVNIVKLKEKLSGETLTYLNTHIALTALAKQKSSEMLAALAESTGGAIIVSGDFNYQQDTENYQIMVNGVLADSNVLAEDSDTGGTFHGFNGTIDTPWPKPIDFIFVTEQYLQASSYKIIRDHNEEGHYPSDHYPIKAALRLKAP